MIVAIIKDDHTTKPGYYSTTSYNEKLEAKIKEKNDEPKIRAKVALEFDVKPDDIFKFWTIL